MNYFVPKNHNNAMSFNDLNTNVWIGIILKTESITDIDALYKSNMAMFQGIYDKYDNIREYVENLRLKTIINDAYNKFVKDEIYCFTGNPIADNLLTDWTSEAHDCEEDYDKQLETEDKLIFRLYKLDKQKLIDFINMSILRNIFPSDFWRLDYENEILHIQYLLHNLPNISQWETVFLVLESENFYGMYRESDKMKAVYPSGIWSLADHYDK